MARIEPDAKPDAMYILEPFLFSSRRGQAGTIAAKIMGCSSAGKFSYEKAISLRGGFVLDEQHCDLEGFGQK